MDKTTIPSSDHRVSSTSRYQYISCMMPSLPLSSTSTSPIQPCFYAQTPM
jgi:hypothetical protein